jgi:hypothetical protein
MRYYTYNEIPNNWKEILTNHLEKTKQEQWILTEEGLYKYINNVLHKFKLWLSEDETISTETICQSEMRWTKFDTVYNIPTQHQVINMKTSSYKLHPKSITTFIVEERDKVSDYYFESEEAIDNHSLLQDIDSFLSMLK